MPRSRETLIGISCSLFWKSHLWALQLPFHLLPLSLYTLMCRILKNYSSDSPSKTQTENCTPLFTSEVSVAVSTKFHLQINTQLQLYPFYSRNVLVLSSNNITCHCDADDTQPHLFSPSWQYTGWSIHLLMPLWHFCMNSWPASRLQPWQEWSRCSSFKALPALRKIFPSPLTAPQWPLLHVNRVTVIADNQLSFIKHVFVTTAPHTYCTLYISSAHPSFPHRGRGHPPTFLVQKSSLTVDLVQIKSYTRKKKTKYTLLAFLCCTVSWTETWVKLDILEFCVHCCTEIYTHWISLYFYIFCIIFMKFLHTKQ